MISNQFKRELEQSGYIHFPLPLHQENGLDAEIKSKKAIASKTVWSNGTTENWVITGKGNIDAVYDEELKKNVLRMSSLAKYPPEEGARNFGNLQAKLTVDNEDWSEYNRISFRVRPDYPARKNITVIMAIFNDGEVKIPDPYHREGYHVVNVVNHEWNEIVWEFPSLKYDKVTELYLYSFLGGLNGENSNYVQFDFDDIILEKIEEPENIVGWQGNKNRILYSTSGYLNKGEKIALSTVDCDEFSLIDVTGKEVYSKKAELSENDKGKFYKLDFTDFDLQGEYTIKTGNVESKSFYISDSMLDSAILKTVNFLFCERCGHPVPGVHGGCHFDTVAEHDGKKAVYNGGWHDAGDMSQQTLQSAEIAHALLEVYEKLTDPMMKARVLEEANWGIDFLLRTHFGNGFHISSAGLSKYTDNIIGTDDDITNVRVTDYAYDNFLFAGILAKAYKAFSGLYDGRAAACLDVAKEDFAAAYKRYVENGVEKPIQLHEHTYPTSESMYFSGACWAASMLYDVTKDEEYAKIARDFAELILECQETGDAGIAIKGFFYRDKTHKFIVHHNHQSREHIFMLALTTLAKTQPKSTDLPKWENAIRLYGDYLKDISKNTLPYGMVPAGVYRPEEVEDKETFAFCNMGSKYDLEAPNYPIQVKKGKDLGNGFYLRNFPVWFSFRGNAAVTMSTGKGAALAGNYLNDDKLLQIGREQLYFTLGKNPFGQSLMYGEGQRYPQLYATSSGELCGELPVGIEAYLNEDIPYFPHGNNCTYKEVWTSPSGRFLWLCAEVL